MSKRRKQKTVGDLWPGDVIAVRRPGACVEMARRINNIETVKSPCHPVDLVRLVFDGFELVVREDSPLV